MGKTLIFWPRYPLYMNPQENKWNHPTTKLFIPFYRSSIKELIFDVNNIFDQLNFNVDKIHC